MNRNLNPQRSHAVQTDPQARYASLLFTSYASLLVRLHKPEVQTENRCGTGLLRTLLQQLDLRLDLVRKSVLGIAGAA